METPKVVVVVCVGGGEKGGRGRGGRGGGNTGSWLDSVFDVFLPSSPHESQRIRPDTNAVGHRVTCEQESNITHHEANRRRRPTHRTPAGWCESVNDRARNSKRILLSCGPATLIFIAGRASTGRTFVKRFPTLWNKWCEQLLARTRTRRQSARPRPAYSTIVHHRDKRTATEVGNTLPSPDKQKHGPSHNPRRALSDALTPWPDDIKKTCGLDSEVAQ